MSRMVIDSARSANRCSWMSLCSVAVPAEHRADQPRLEVRQHLHGRQRGAALRRERFAVPRAAEQALVFGQRVFDLRVLRQHRTVGDAEAFGRLALGGEEIADAVLRHDARRFLRERAAQILGAWGQFLHV